MKFSKRKVLSRTALAVLGLILAGLAFIYFTPGYNLYLVRSESMKPAINMGDLIITGPLNGPVNGEVKPGTVVTYEYQKELVTHRVKSIEGTALVTQGDAVEDPDPWSVAMSSVKGIYLFKIPYVGYVTNFVQTKLGWFLTRSGFFPLPDRLAELIRRIAGLRNCIVHYKAEPTVVGTWEGGWVDLKRQLDGLDFDAVLDTPSQLEEMLSLGLLGLDPNLGRAINAYDMVVEAAKPPDEPS